MFTRVFTAAVLLLVAVWAVLPYVALRSFGQAVDSGDAARLEKVVDWQSVHNHLREDIKRRLSVNLDKEGAPANADEALARSALKLLGSAIADGLIETYATPEALMAVLRAIAEAGEGRGTFLDTVSYAFFASPTHFRVHVKPAGSDGEPLVLTFTFQDFGWIVTRIEFPFDELEKGPAKKESVQPKQGPKDQKR